jgi:hypothetical protein
MLPVYLAASLGEWDATITTTTTITITNTATTTTTNTNTNTHYLCIGKLKGKEGKDEGPKMMSNQLLQKTAHKVWPFYPFFHVFVDRLFFVFPFNFRQNFDCILNILLCLGAEGRERSTGDGRRGSRHAAGT